MFPLFSKTGCTTLGYVERAERIKRDIVLTVLEEIKHADLEKPPAYATTFIYRKMKELLREDPYREIKHRYNEKAMELYEQHRTKVLNSSDPLDYAARLAISGNIIDFGIFTSVDIEGTIRKVLHNPLEVDHIELLRKEIEQQNELLYLLDNTGEIAFDRLLIEVLQKMGKKVTAVVKGGAVINDATMEDALQVGLTDICKVIDNGSDAVGTILQWTSEEFRKEFDRYGLIISKGQGNFETLLESEKNIFFLFQVKCDVVARELGSERGAMILKHKDSLN